MLRAELFMSATARPDIAKRSAGCERAVRRRVHGFPCAEYHIPLLLKASDRFRDQCLPRMAREEAYSGWIAHFLMQEFGARRVIVESHHDGRALLSALRQHL
jgi:hypothetical protein